MSTTEVSGLMKYKDAAGNLFLLLPVTTKDNVDGLEEIDAHLLDTENPHGTTAEQVGAAKSEHNQAASTITAGTLGGKVLANETAAATVATAQLRNSSLHASDTAPTTNGAIAWTYE